MQLWQEPLCHWWLFVLAPLWSPSKLQQFSHQQQSLFITTAITCSGVCCCLDWTWQTDRVGCLSVCPRKRYHLLIMIVDKCPVTGGPDGGSSAWSHIGVFNAHKEAFHSLDRKYLLLIGRKLCFLKHFCWQRCLFIIKTFARIATLNTSFLGKCYDLSQLKWSGRG